jgi:hypothetical protein
MLDVGELSDQFCDWVYIYIYILASGGTSCTACAAGSYSSAQGRSSVEEESVQMDRAIIRGYCCVAEEPPVEQISCCVSLKEK